MDRKLYVNAMKGVETCTGHPLLQKAFQNTIVKRTNKSCPLPWIHAQQLQSRNNILNLSLHVNE